MNNDSKKEFRIFFATLVIIGAMFIGGDAYFKTQIKPSGLLADIAATVQPQNNVETIPTSTIIIPTTSSSSTPVSLTLPYFLNASTSNETYWPKAWGNISFVNNGLALTPDPTTHGANSFIKGASSWTNYAVNADVTWLMGGWFDIVARVTRNTQNFVYCEFGSNGTEIIERVNGIDTQLALASASTTNIEGASENFGIKVYGNDIACTMAGKEVVGARVQNTMESPAGGIGFVIFGAPPGQKQVGINNVSVSALSYDTIIAPFPVATATPPSAVPPPSAVVQPAPAKTVLQAPATTPTPTATTTKTLPYSTDTFTRSQGWNTWWGNFSLATNSLTMGASTDGTSGGVLLDGTNAWTNYTFTATLNWIKGETFGLYARYTNAQNYVLCYFDESYLGGVQISLEQHINGREYTLAQGTAMNYNQWGGSNVTAYIQVEDSQGTCSFDNYVVSSYGTGNTINPPYSGRIGFTTWDPNINNSQIVVKSISVTSIGT